MKKITLPTGYLIVDEYKNGKLETLSIGDYGKSRNIRAPFLGYMNEINGVSNGPIMPLQEKWVITLSTQYGCKVGCSFCDVPNVLFAGNVSVNDLEKQFLNAIGCFPEIKYTDRLNVHFARMGEPSFNYKNVFEFTRKLYLEKKRYQDITGIRFEVIHPVFTTMLPARLGITKLMGILEGWCDIKNNLYNGQAGLQLSINSTDDGQRKEMFGDDSLLLEEIAYMASYLPEPIGRKYCLNFAVHDNTIIDGRRLADLFDPEIFMCKITPIHETTTSQENGIKTTDGYKSYTPYKPFEEELMNAGFDTIVFIPSTDEEDGLVTCGNAILGGSQLRV